MVQGCWRLLLPCATRLKKYIDKATVVDFVYLGAGEKASDLKET